MLFFQFFEFPCQNLSQAQISFSGYFTITRWDCSIGLISVAASMCFYTQVGWLLRKNGNEQSRLCIFLLSGHLGRFEAVRLIEVSLHVRHYVHFYTVFRQFIRTKMRKKIIKKFLIIFNQIILLYLNFRQRTTSNMWTCDATYKNVLSHPTKIPPPHTRAKIGDQFLRQSPWSNGRYQISTRFSGWYHIRWWEMDHYIQHSYETFLSF